MLKLLLLLHLLTAIFAIGPLAHAVTTASRGLRHADPVALQGSSRTAKVYAAASVLVVIFGMGLMSQKRERSADPPRRLSSPEERSGGGRVETPATTDLSSYTARVAASGGVVALIFAVIVVLMVYRPGS